MALVDRIRAAREEWVTAGGKEWLVRRPTEVQFGKWLKAEDVTPLVCRCVVGWKLPEHELVPGGGGTVPEFDAESFREWVEDRPETLGELIDRVREIIQRHNAKIAALEKN